MKSYKETLFEKCISAPVVNISELRSLAWNGIPHKYRAVTWKLLLGYIPTNKARRTNCLQRRRDEYRKGLQQLYNVSDGKVQVRSAHESVILDQILKDVPRTAPRLGLFANERIRTSLEHILLLWATRNPASSYVQGINDLVTPFLVVFLKECYDGKDVIGDDINNMSNEKLLEVEADCYGCLTNLLSGIHDHYTEDQPGIQRMVIKLEKLVEYIDPDLCNHINKTGLKFLWFSFKWMNCYLIREFPLVNIIRMWDTYLSEENDGFEEFHIYVCTALLRHFSHNLKSLEFEGLFEFIQNIPCLEWGNSETEMLLSEAFVLRSLHDGNHSSLKDRTKSKQGTMDESNKKSIYSSPTSLLYDSEILMY